MRRPHWSRRWSTRSRTAAAEPETVPDGNGLETDPVGSDIAEDHPAETAEGHVQPANMPPPETSPPPDPAAIRADAIAHARAVIDLCRLAGQPQMAGRFLEEDADLDKVRAALLAAKAEAEPEITSHHAQPGRTSAARPWGEIVARTFKLKG